MDIADKRSGKRGGGGIRGERTKLLQEPITEFTIHLARNHEVYLRRLSPTKPPAYTPSVMLSRSSWRPPILTSH